MTTSTPATTTATHLSAPAPITRQTKALLGCGIAAGPLFAAVVLVQALTRPGFDPRRHPLSLLSLSDLGWIQITNFVLAGMLVLASAVGIRRALHPGRAGTGGPLLIGAYGLALIWAGVFVADPASGYPPGTAATAGQVSWHGMLHNLGPTVTSLALTAACLVFARRFTRRGQRGWAAYSLATATANLLLGTVAIPVGDFRLMLLGGILIWLWASAIAAHLVGILRPRRAAQHRS